MKKFVNDLMQKHNTRNPYEIAHNLGIYVIEEDLGSINGYYNKVLNTQFIHINSRLSSIHKFFVVAHELGHALLHADCDLHFSNGYEYNKLEAEADLFAGTLLMDEHLFNKEDLFKFYEVYRKIKNNFRIITGGFENGVSNCS